MSIKKKKLLITVVGAILLLVTSIITSKAQNILYPNDVNNVSATASDSAIVLRWDVTLDSEGKEVSKYKIFYGTGSILTNDTNYTFTPIVTPDNSTTYTARGFLNGITYYFSVVAIDSKGVQSEYYSTEIFATPKEADPDDKEAPAVLKAEALFIDKVEVIFSEEVMLPVSNPESAFTITEQLDTDNLLTVFSAEVKEDDKTKIILKTGDQVKNENYILTAGIGVSDKAGNPIMSGVTDTAVFKGVDVIEPEEQKESAPREPEETSGTGALAITPVIIPPDTIPPEDITNFLITFKRQLELINKYIVTLTWTASINSARDLIDQILYMSLNKGQTYDSGILLGASAVNYEVSNLEGGKEYTFKITTKDDKGNESVGAIKAIRLPQSGLDLVATFALSGFASASYVIFRRKNKKT